MPRRSSLCAHCFAAWALIRTVQRPSITSSVEYTTACIKGKSNIIGGHERSKHIDIRKHFTHEAIKNGHTILRKIVTMSQLADNNNTLALIINHQRQIICVEDG